jgi:glycosyltransferase involved in cell wall biosynthesis
MSQTKARNIKMKISIVTISFNQAKYLRHCIDSILAQTDCELEYIVVDPGSTDGSRALIESYGDRIVRVFERDNGPADGLNKGFAVATGDIYGFINSDDYLLPGALKQITQFFLQHPGQVFVTGGGYTENGSAQRTPIYPSALTSFSMLNRSAVMFQQTTFFPAVLYQQVGGFNTNNTTCWDYELFLNFLIKGARHEVLKEDLAVFRLYEGSISGSGRLEEQYFKDLDHLFLKHVGRRRGWFDRVLTGLLRIQRKLIRGH